AIKGLPEEQRPTIGVLAERLQVEHHTAVGLGDRLCGAGLAVRLRNADDRREILLRISARGERLLHRLSRAHREEWKPVGPDLVEAREPLFCAPRAGRSASSAGGALK